MMDDFGSVCVARPSQIEEKRRQFVPIVARAFAELGYRRTTTAELARRCGVQENILYRIWPDKKAMFIAAINYVYDNSAMVWGRLLAEGEASQSPAERVLEYESQHHGEHGNYRIIFAGLSETDDPEIRDALRQMYGRFHQFIARQMAAHRGEKADGEARLQAWAVVGLGTVANIARELGLIDDDERCALFERVGGAFLKPVES